MTTLDIIDDGFAVIVGERGRYEMSGGMAVRIIAMYRHQQQEHGDVMAQTYLMGVIDGILLQIDKRAKDVVDEYRRRYP